MLSRTTTLLLLRLAAIFAMLAGIASSAEHLYVTFTTPLLPEQTPFARVPAMIGGVAILIALAAISFGLYGIAALLEQVSLMGIQSIPQGEQPNELILEVLKAMRAKLEQLPANVASEWAAQSSVLGATRQNLLEHAPGNNGPEITNALQRIAARLDEIRDLCLLDETQRQARVVEGKAHRKAALLAAGADSLRKRAWPNLDKITAALDNEYPDDADAAQLKEQITHARKEAENQAASEIFSRVEDLMAVSSWDRAHELSAKFAHDFPTNADAQALLARVNRERDLYIETSVNRLYDQIKVDIERRRWRPALVGAHKLLKDFSGHRKTARIRAQFRTIQDNAEIEERQEQEALIQELLRGKRFAEAIETAEDLIDRFPQSPQAASLEELLPKLKALAMHDEVGPESAAQQSE